MDMTDWHEFRQALDLQLRVIKALIRREFIAMNGRQGAGFLMLFAEPIIIIGFIMMIIVTRSGGRFGVGFPIYAFALSGWGIMWLVRYPIQRTGPAIVANLSFLAHRQITVLDLAVSRCLLILLAVLASLFVIVVIYATFLIEIRINDPGLIVLGLLFTLWYAFVSSVFAVGISTYTALGPKFAPLFSIFHVFTTGAMYMVEWLPVKWHTAALLFPMINVTEMTRDGMFGDLAICHYDIKYTFIFMLFYTAFTFRFLAVKARWGKINGSTG